jgi:hypothetical protein
MGEKITYSFNGLEDKVFDVKDGMIVPDSENVNFNIAPREQDRWFRAVVWVGSFDALDCSLEFERYDVVKTTRYGVWLQKVGYYHGAEPFFVLGTARKQRCAPTKRLALEDAKIRCRHEVNYKRNALERAEAKYKFLKALVIPE